MPTAPIYNLQGERTGTLELAPEVFGVTPNPAVLHDVILAQAANARETIAHTKRRGEVRGGGKKPWAQKHTGRARHGSIRSPIWVGGGKVFGPHRDRNYQQKVNVKVRRQALRMALSDKVAHGALVVIDAPEFATAKTKSAKHLLDIILATVDTKKRAPSALVVLPAEERNARRSFANLPKITGIDAAHLNVADVLRNDVCVVTRAAVVRATAVFSPKKRRSA
ncbi:50S ribosomal protein L4 [Candidatus Uhrbacteria bacterium]|nr:50S ribosomal protein L4 [Candidatus Uhrbacteria bacterium]